jgi:hypothetical protein
MASTMSLLRTRNHYPSAVYRVCCAILTLHIAAGIVTYRTLMRDFIRGVAATNGWRDSRRRDVPTFLGAEEGLVR